MSLWAAFRKEVDGCTVEEDDYSFLVWKAFEEHVFIYETYVREDCRGKGYMEKRMDVLRDKFPKLDVMTSIELGDPGYYATKAALNYGFRTIGVDGTRLFLKMAHKEK